MIHMISIFHFQCDDGDESIEWTLTLIPSSVSSVTTDVTIDRRLLLFLVSSVSYQ